MAESKDYSFVLAKYHTMVADPLGAILDDQNLDRAIARVKANKGSPGIDGMTVDEIKDFFGRHREEIKAMIRNKAYKASPVRRVRIPKDNKGNLRPLGIPTAVDRVLQQAVAQVLIVIFEETFHDSSFGYRTELSAWDAIEQACQYLNEGYEWVVDLDIAKFFDTVHHDKLISMIRKEMNDAPTLHLIRAFLKSGAMENGIVTPTEMGVPQGGPLSSVLSLIYLTPLDNEMEARGYRFCRYADDVVIFTKSKMAAERVLKSISNWIEKHLFLKVNLEKSKVVRPRNSKFLGFTFIKYQVEKPIEKKGKQEPNTEMSNEGNKGEEKKTEMVWIWVPHPHRDSIKKFRRNIKQAVKRRYANSMELGPFIQKVNQKVAGWINYYSICPGLTSFLRRFSGNFRHWVRVWILKHWKNRRTIFENLKKFFYYIKRNNLKCKEEDFIPIKEEITEGYIFGQCFTRCGWYKLGNTEVVNNILNPKILHAPLFKEGLSKKIALIDPLDCYSKKRADKSSFWYTFAD